MELVRLRSRILGKTFSSVQGIRKIHCRLIGRMLLKKTMLSVEEVLI